MWIDVSKMTRLSHNNYEDVGRNMRNKLCVNRFATHSHDKIAPLGKLLVLWHECLYQWLWT